MGQGATWINAVIGAVITLGLSFTGISPLLGGGVAGYLQAEPPARGARVGAISGGLPTIPLFLIVVLGFVLFAAIPTGFSFLGGLELVVIFVVMLPMMLLWFVGLNAAGGYVGGCLHMET